MNPLKMTMLNHAAVEALCSASYLENYLDCLDSLPDDLQRNVSQMRELDLQYNDLLKDIEHYRNNYQKETEAVTKKRTILQIQRSLLKCQELGDEKLQVVSQIIENIENRSRQLEQDLENLDPAANRDIAEPPEKEIKEPTPIVTPAVTTPLTTTPAAVVKQVKEVAEKQERSGHKRQRRQRTHHDSTKDDEKKGNKEEKEKPKKKKKRKTKKEKEGAQSPIDAPIDPDEPTYCLCDQVSYGEMIGCDNDSCPIEWFHFNCVALTTKPKGRWYCPSCRGDRPNMKRPDLK